MRYPILIFIALIFVSSSCETDKQIRCTTCDQPNDYDYLDNYKVDSMCSGDLCLAYFNIWKELVKEKNNLSQDFIDNHIVYCYSEINSWAHGVSYRICYKLKVDWAIAYNCDQFIIKINADNTYYPALDLPRDTYLSKEKVKIAVDHRAFFSDIIKMSNVDKIKYTTLDNALQDLIRFSGVNQLCLNMITINDDNGDLILEAVTQYENEENLCMIGTIDLITGDKEVNDTPCWTD